MIERIWAIYNPDCQMWFCGADDGWGVLGNAHRFTTEERSRLAITDFMPDYEGDTIQWIPVAEIESGTKPQVAVELTLDEARAFQTFALNGQSDVECAPGVSNAFIRAGRRASKKLDDAVSDAER